MHTIEFSRTRHHPYTTNPMVLREADLPPSVPLSRAVLGNLSSLAHISCAAAQTYEPAASASGSVALTRDYITRIHTINANTTANRARRAPGLRSGAATAHAEAAAPARKPAKRDAFRPEAFARNAMRCPKRFGAGASPLSGRRQHPRNECRSRHPGENRSRARSARLRAVRSRVQKPDRCK